MDQPVRVGTVVKGEMASIGIVAGQEPPPTRAWLRKQKHFERALALIESRGGVTAVTWWKVYGLRGGVLLWPETEIEYLRELDIDDFMTAIDHHIHESRIDLVRDFPALAKEAVLRARLQKLT
jgi:hypothetical protein